MQLSILMGEAAKNSKNEQKNKDVISILRHAKSKMNPIDFIPSILSNFQHTSW